MPWSAPDDPVDFDEAIAWFRKRVSVSRAEFDRLSAASKRKAFAAANVAQLDLVNHVWKAIDAALKAGTALEDFKKAVDADLRKAWGGTVKDPAWRLETIFRTNVQLAYGSGRYKQAKHPDVVSDRPIWMFDSILDGRETEICKACDATKLPADDAWWKTHTPPLHFNCRSGFIALSDQEAGHVTRTPPDATAGNGFGLPPDASEWEPDLSKYPGQLALPFEGKQAAAPPPPPPAKLVPGTHVKKVAKGRGVDASTVEDMLGSISDAETLRFLESQPLSELSFKKQSRAGRKAVNGWYQRSTRRLEVGSARSPHTFGQAFVPGSTPSSTWSISSSQTTKEAAAKGTLRHELGHHVHLFEGRGTKADKVVIDAYARALKDKSFITRYAKSDPDEYFAECYVAYYFRRSDLKAHDPNGLRMVEDVLKLRGILP